MTETERPSRGWLSRMFPARAQGQAKAKFSSYLSIYNDWDLLAASLKSVAPYLDELVVVDGAYSWMVPYLRRLGIDPERSASRVYDAIAASGIPFRVVSGLSINEIDKRRAGYEACRNRYIFRVDADEVLHFDASALDDFVTSGGIVGEMENPTYVAPGYVVGGEGRRELPRTGFLFDRDKVGSDIHLNYIWLVLTKDELPCAGQRPFPAYPRALAVSAHLTGWRTPETAQQRSAFYVLNRLRQTGIGWFEDLKGKPLEDFDLLFSRVPAKSFQNMLRHTRFSLGTFALTQGQTIAPTPLTPQQESVFAPLFRHFLDSLAACNRAATTVPQSFGWGSDVVIDLSSAAAYDAIVKDGAITLRFSANPSELTASARTLTSAAPQSVETLLEVGLEGDIARIAAPARRCNETLRSVLSIRPRGGDGPLGDYLIL